MVEELIMKNRSRRRFYQNEAVSIDALKGLVNLARLSASAGNLQPLRYLLSNEPERNDVIFSTLAWAGYLKDWPGPEEGERPPAYIMVLGDTEVAKNFGCDHGIAAQSIMLGAVEQGLGGCIIASIKKEELRGALKIPKSYEILLVLAIGRPKETVVIEDVKEDIKYWRDEKGVHHVPKRRLEDIIIG
jgi:nitroreductase